MLASASETQELGTVDEGVHLVTSEQAELSVEAQEALGMLVASPEGQTITAERLDAGDTRTVLLDGEEAIVALIGGQAEIAVEGDGSVKPLETEEQQVALAEAKDREIQRTLSVQVPEGTLLAKAWLAGEAEDLSVSIDAEGQRVLQASENQLATGVPLRPAAVDAVGLDVELDAHRLDGTLGLAFTTIENTTFLGGDDTAGEAEDETAFNQTVPIASLPYAPIAFTVPEDEAPAQLTVDIDGGYIFDASVYDEEGQLLDHLHAGEALEEHRWQCREIFSCEFQASQRESMVPQTVEGELAAGEHVLFARATAATGSFEIVGANGTALLPSAEVANITMLDVASERSFTTTQPVLDAWYYSGYDSADADTSLVVNIENTTAYEHRALAQTFGQEIDSETTIAPDAFVAGQVDIAFDGATQPVVNDEMLTLVLASD